MSELKKFHSLCSEEVIHSGWLCGFDAEWISFGSHAKFKLKGLTSTAFVEWDGDQFRLNIIGPEIVYYETSRSIGTAEQALRRVSSLLCEHPSS